MGPFFSDSMGPQNCKKNVGLVFTMHIGALINFSYYSFFFNYSYFVQAEI